MITENTIKFFLFAGVFLIIKTIVDGKPKKKTKSYNKNNICIIKILFDMIKFFFNIIKDIIINKPPYIPTEYTESQYNRLQKYNSKPKYYKPKKNIVSVSRIGEYFNIPATNINKTFIKLKWIEYSGKGKIPTELGKTQGATEKYDKRYKTNYVMWEIDILKNEALIDALKELSREDNIKNKNIYKEKIEKGELYEEYVANHYRNLGYTIIENGKEKGRKDGGIDLIAKTATEAILIQCKDWDKNRKWKITQKNILEFRSRARDFVEDNPELKSYLLTARYTISEEFIDISAIKHIEEIQKKGKRVDYEIIKMDSV